MFKKALLAATLFGAVSATPNYFQSKHGCSAPKVGASYMKSVAVAGTGDAMKFYKKGDATKAAVAKYEAGDYVLELTQTGQAFVHFGGPQQVSVMGDDSTKTNGSGGECGHTTAVTSNGAFAVGITSTETDLVITLGSAAQKGAVSVFTVTIPSAAPAVGPAAPTAAPPTAAGGIPVPPTGSKVGLQIAANEVDFTKVQDDDKLQASLALLLPQQIGNSMTDESLKALGLDKTEFENIIKGMKLVSSRDTAAKTIAWYITFSLPDLNMFPKFAADLTNKAVSDQINQLGPALLCGGVCKITKYGYYVGTASPTTSPTASPIVSPTAISDPNAALALSASSMLGLGLLLAQL